MAQIKTNLQYGVTGSLQTGSIAGDAIDGTKIADDAINSEHYAGTSVDDAHINDVASSKLTGTIATARLGSGTASSSTFLRGDQSYAEAGGGAFTKLLTATASNSSSLEFNSTYINSTYNRYLFLFTRVRPATDNQQVEVEHSANNGSSNVTGTTDYIQHFQYNGQTSSEYYHTSGSAQSSAWLTNGNIGSGANEGYCGELWFSRGDSDYAFASSTIVSTNSSNCQHWDGAYGVFSSGINFVRFKFANGNITSGSITLYGVEN